MKQKILFIGLGMMGYPMATLLSKAGYPLSVADADAKRARQFADEFHASAVALDEPSAIDADIVITMLPSSSVVEAVLLGADGSAGIVPHLKPGTAIIDMSSSEPLRSRQLAETLATKDIRFIDAPVSGGVKKATDGSLAIMVGGAKETFDACSPILGEMGKTLFHVGGPGAGHAIKALNNYVSAAGLVAAVEALHVGERFGLDPAVMTDVINASSGRNNTTENKIKQYMLSATFNSAFALQLMAKDLGIAMDLGKSLGYPMPLGDECRGIWDSAASRLDRTGDHTEMYRLLARQS